MKLKMKQVKLKRMKDKIEQNDLKYETNKYIYI